MFQIKRKEKNKPNIKNRKYGQVHLRHSKKGVYSCLFAVSNFILQLSFLAAAFTTRGQLHAIVGALAFSSTLFAGFGIYLGILGFKEKEKNYMTCKLGIGGNGLVVLFYILLFVRGLL